MATHEAKLGRMEELWRRSGEFSPSGWLRPRLHLREPDTQPYVEYGASVPPLAAHHSTPLSIPRHPSSFDFSSSPPSLESWTRLLRDGGDLYWITATPGIPFIDFRRSRVMHPIFRHPHPLVLPRCVVSIYCPRLQPTGHTTISEE